MMKKNTGGDRTRGLVMFKKGQSGNPAGRPKGIKNSVRSHIRRLLDKMAPADVLAALEAEYGGLKAQTCGDAIAAVMLIGAMRGDPQLIKMILEQTEIPLPIQIQQEIEATGNITLTIKPPTFENEGEEEDEGEPEEDASIDAGTGQDAE